MSTNDRTDVGEASHADAVKPAATASAWTIGGLVAAGAAATAIALGLVTASLGTGGRAPLTAADARGGSTPPVAQVEAAPGLVEATLLEPTQDGHAPTEPDLAPVEPQPTLPQPPLTAPVPRQSNPAPDLPAHASSIASTPAPAASPAPAPETAPAEAAPLSITSAEQVSDGAVALGISGEPHREVRAFADGHDTAGPGMSAGAPLALAMAAQEPLATVTLRADGTGVLLIALTHEQALADVSIEVRYVGDSGASASRRLSELWGLRDELLGLVTIPQPPATAPPDAALTPPTDSTSSSDTSDDPSTQTEPAAPPQPVSPGPVPPLDAPVPPLDAPLPPLDAPAPLLGAPAAPLGEEPAATIARPGLSADVETLSAPDVVATPIAADGEMTGD
ncbi:hypothetical protein [Microbacterium sp. NPDC096154]|uniref:hypothetical protein n=1 Tax=Microbacterium sp. NPDC096154 TaxID=3155549 RepID=UPI003328B9D4